MIRHILCLLAIAAAANAGMILGAPGGPPDTGFFDENNGATGRRVVAAIA
jgi:hypothetical protein